MRGEGRRRGGWAGVVRLVQVGLWLALAAGCTAAAGPTPDPDPELSAPERMRAWARAARSAPFQTIRYNPTGPSCEAPPFEVRVGDRWWRTRLVARGALPGALDDLERRAAATENASQVAFFYVTGALDDVPVPLCRNGALGFVLLVDEVHTDPP